MVLPTNLSHGSEKSHSKDLFATPKNFTSSALPTTWATTRMDEKIHSGFKS
jgi:hypothetical protein